MADQNWQKVREIFGSALLRKREEREKYLAETCANDEALLSEVKSLLSSLDSAESFLETPAVASVADALVHDVQRMEKGKCLGHYEIIKQIGAGAMGTVYLAHDRKLERKVAIKVLNDNFSQGADLDRFLREAKLASALNHPNILVVHEVGEAAGTHFIVSEFIEGKTLRDILKEAPPTLPEVLNFSIQISKAIEAAHEAKLIHRDIKPENIMIRPDGFVKILDFGLAKLVERKNKSLLGLDGSSLEQNQTAEGVILGTINYMSPEQARGKDIDARTDIWSLGVCIYEMLTGRPPFAGETTSDTISEILSKDPAPLTKDVPGIPKELEGIVNQALSKPREERYQRINDMLAKLRDLKHQLEFAPKLGVAEAKSRVDKITTSQSSVITAARTVPLASNSEPGKAKSKSGKIGVATAFLFVAAVVAAYYFLNRDTISIKKVIEFSAGPATRLTSNGRVKTSVVDPDGKFIIYAQEESDQRQSLWMQHIGDESGKQITSVANVHYHGLNISPDGNLLYYTDAEGALYRIAIQDGAARKVTDGLGNFSGSHIAISPNSTQIAYVRAAEKNTPLFIANSDGTNERQLASFETMSQFQTLSWSPDGQVIANGFYRAGFNNFLAVHVSDGTFETILPEDWSAVGNSAWLPDSKSFLAIAIRNDADTNFQIWQITYPGGEAHQITNDTNNYQDIGLTSDGRILTAVRNEQIGHLWLMPAGDEGVAARQLTVGFEKFDGGYSLGWLPDGKIFYDTLPSGKATVWAIDADGSNSQKLVKSVTLAAVSRDGRYLVAQKGSGDNIGLWITDLRDGIERQLTKGVDAWPSFSPDGKWIVFTRYANLVTLWKVPVEGGEPAEIARAGVVCPAISPDGKMVAAVQGKIRLFSFSDGKKIKTFDAEPERQERSAKQNLQWSLDGKAIYYVALRRGVSNIWRQPIDGSSPVQVTRFDSGRIFNFAFSPDGKQLALSRGTINSDVVLFKRLN
jgi:eukaryotic-like serine/threonine-protein kinase